MATIDKRGHYRVWAGLLGVAALLLALLAVPAAGPVAVAQDGPAAADDEGDEDATPPASPLIATVEHGRLLGSYASEEHQRVIAWKGIPFAAPPVGPNRWRAPQPVEPWDGIRDATAFGASCPQPESSNPVGITPQRAEQDEDCLYLNVFAPAEGLAAATDGDDDTAGPARPVMVWIHGGGMTIGAGSLPTYDGTVLADTHDVVIVTINYRLGILGFLAHPGLSAENEAGLSGNYGLRDQIQALEWVRDNIASFGGDPSRVTIFGESAGSVCVSLLMASPAAEGLFHRAIMQSGVGIGVQQRLAEAVGRTQSAHDAGIEVAQQLGVPEDAEDPIAALRAMPARALVDGIRTAVGLYSSGHSYNAIIDGEGGVLPEDPLVVWREGRQHHVPIMAGANRDEGTVFIGSNTMQSEVALRATVRALAGPHADRMLELYPVEGNGGGAEIRGIWNDITTDYAFLAPSRLVVRWHAAQTEQPAYLYFFTHVLPFPRVRQLGAFHGLEIPFVFDTLQPVLRRGGGGDVANAMSQAWTSFAATGVPSLPGGEDAATWSAWQDESQPFLEIATRRVGPSQRLRSEKLDLMEAIIAHNRGWDTIDAPTEQPEAGDGDEGDTESDGQ